MIPRIALASGMIVLFATSPTRAAEWHVSPAGTAAGDGSVGAPWDLATAATGVAKTIAPGDTVWVHAGTYGDGGDQPFDLILHGAEGSPIVFRAPRDERATIDGGVTVSGTWITLWGLEVTNSGTQRDVMSEAGSPSARLGGVNLYGRGASAINLVVHDTGHPAIGFWSGPGDGAEVYGCILWGNGIYDPSFSGSPRGNGTYAQNELGRRRIADNVSFRNWTEGLDAHSAGQGFVNGFHFEGNIVFDNPVGQITTNTVAPENPMRDLRITDNCTYRRSADNAKTSVQMGYYNEVFNEDVEVTGNYLVMGSDDDRAFHIKLFESATITGNTIVSARYHGWWWNGVPGESVIWDGNTYFGGNGASFVLGPGSGVDNGVNFLDFDDWRAQTGFDAASSFSPSNPTGTHVCKRRNQYEPDRAFVAIYNWDLAPEVAVDVSDLMSAGDDWELVDVQNYFAGPVAEGTFDGSTVAFPMDLSTFAPIVGDYTHWSQSHTAPEFAVFEVRSRPGSGGAGGAGSGSVASAGSGANGSGGSGGSGGGQPVGPGAGPDASAGSDRAAAVGAGGSGEGAEDSGGCDCRTTPPRRDGGGWLAAGSLMGALATRRRRREARR